MGNCYGCKFAVEARSHLRHGEQVRCKWAEENFGGVRWVDALEESKCGQFQPFKGEPAEPLEKDVFSNCPQCRGTGLITVQYITGPQQIKCHKCGGIGSVLT